MAYRVELTIKNEEEMKISPGKEKLKKLIIKESFL